MVLRGLGLGLGKLLRWEGDEIAGLMVLGVLEVKEARLIFGLGRLSIRLESMGMLAVTGSVGCLGVEEN